MSDINSVTVVGRLTRDAELKYTNSGTAITNMSIAVNRRVKSGDQWKDEASFFDVVLWGKLGEKLSQYLLKGKQIAISGELEQKRWEKDGQKRSKVEIKATSIQLLGASDGVNRGSAEPQQNNQQQNTPQNDQRSFEDDIPF